MSYSHSNEANTLPRSFRYHHIEPRTPEPLTADEPRQPSPPRPRLKVKRRNVSTLQAPTEQFLASVAAADVPIPTIEIPQIRAHISEDLEMPDRESPPVGISRFLSPAPNLRLASPPKTPDPMRSIDQPSSQRPDWSMGSPSPVEEYFPRSTSVSSNRSDFSDDSLYSGSRMSRPSDDGSCTSPESDIGDPFQFPSMSKTKGKAAARNEPSSSTTLNLDVRSKTRKNAPWAKAQSTHLWSTYLLYLQDPTVTPFRIGAGSVPPEGVCHRVARQARRSWKGPKFAPSAVRRSGRLVSSTIAPRAPKSGSNTPTRDAPKVYAQWPHSSSATRAHLRQMCKSKDTSPVTHHRHLQTRSPTPFTKPTFGAWSRGSEQPRLSTFSTHDIAMSLTTSTTDSMQPDGPLAKLASESSVTPTPSSSFTSLTESTTSGSGETCLGNTENMERTFRLGSPFIARTYGPSSSNTLEDFNRRPSPPRSQSDTVPGPYLHSPLRFNKPRSLNGTQKRRAACDLDDELSTRGAVLRPSILDEQLFGTPFSNRRVRSRGFSLGDDALGHRALSISQRPVFTALAPPPKIELPVTTPSSLIETLITPTGPQLLPSATFEPAPPRLGSPFSEVGPSNTFPRRLFQDGSKTIRRSAFATMGGHQTRRSIESFDFGEGPSLQSRLGILDMKLKEIRERDAANRRYELS